MLDYILWGTSGAGVAYALASWGLKKDTEKENRRRAASNVAGELRNIGFTSLADFFVDYSVGDYSGMAAKMKTLATLMLNGRGFIDEIHKVFDKLLSEKLKDPMFRDELTKRLSQ